MTLASDHQDSITKWIDELRNQDDDATWKIWNKFVRRVVEVANRVLKNSNCRVVDGSDIASDAFQSFFEKGPGHFKSLVDRNDLWKILVVITERKAIDAIRKEMCKKRGGELDRSSLELANLRSHVNPPEIEMMLIDSMNERLESLANETLKHIAIDKMQGLSNAEISANRMIPLRSVERKLKIIRQAWNEG